MDYLIPHVLYPGGGVEERGAISDVVHDDGYTAVADVAGDEGPKPLLSCSVPELWKGQGGRGGGGGRYKGKWMCEEDVYGGLWWGWCGHGESSDRRVPSGS